MWLPANIVSEVEEKARVSYIPVAHTQLWNEHRRPGELRLLTGWAWVARNGSDYRQGFKTMSAAYRDCWYYLVQQTSAPSLTVKRTRTAAAPNTKRLVRTA